HQAADHLHIEMAHAQHSLGSFTHDGKSLVAEAVERGAIDQALTELVGFGGQFSVAQCLVFGFQAIDGCDCTPHALDDALIATSNNAFEKITHATSLWVLIRHRMTDTRTQYNETCHDTVAGLRLHVGLHGLSSILSRDIEAITHICKDWCYEFETTPGQVTALHDGRRTGRRGAPRRVS